MALYPRSTRNLAVAAHAEKLMVTGTTDEVAGAIVPAAPGNAVNTTGVHAAPNVCVSVSVFNSAFTAAPAPVF